MSSIGADKAGEGLNWICLRGSIEESSGGGVERPLGDGNGEVWNEMGECNLASVEEPRRMITESLSSLCQVRVQLVSGCEWEPVWDCLVRQYHYLGYQRLLGHRLKYLALIEDNPVAALSWSAPALKLKVRDRFIGWSDDQRRAHLKRLANNSRFLILPWVRVPNLASHVLSLTMERMVRDWEERFRTELWLLETFVDPSRFKGTSYKAANWKCIGQSNGYRKEGLGYVYHGSIKEVYVYVLKPEFREIIGCEQKPFTRFHRPPPSIEKVEGLKMILRHANWKPELVPWVSLTEKDVELMADELVTFHEQFHDCFGRIEHRRLGLAYISGLMSNMEAKSVEPMAIEFLGQEGVRSLQHFMKGGHWDHEAMQSKNQRILAPLISDRDGMINADSCEFLKKGKESVGVARQYCGCAGKVDNAQSGVFVGYSSEKGYGLLTCTLYMPEVWFTPEYEQRREDNLVPGDLTFQTKLQIAQHLIHRVAESGLFPATWIGCDATFGSDIQFLESLPKGHHYFADVRSNAQVFLRKPKTHLPPYKGRGPRPKKLQLLPDQPQPQSVADIARSTTLSWKPVVLAEGAKGPIVAHVARLRVYPSRDGLPRQSPVWLFMRKTPDGELKYSFVKAPKKMPLKEMVKAATKRWPIEQCFQDGKDQLGMDHYEHRSWPAWHRHMIYVFLALHFLLRLRMRFKKNSSLDATASTQVDRGSSTPSFTYSSRSN
jgi:SRSO17 transposase